MGKGILVLETPWDYELLPRWNQYPTDRGPQMFSEMTWWSHERLWKFIGVPYATVELAVESVGRRLRERLTENLSTIVPTHGSPARG